MKSACFFALCLAWLADMVVLSVIGPLGRHVTASMTLYACGFFILRMVFQTFPKHIKNPHALGLIVGLGLAARTAFLLFPPNTDIYRYLWEGVVQNHGFNPYMTPPDDPSLAFLAQGDLAVFWHEISHKGLTAVYPPAALQLFRLLAWISPTPLFFKAVFLLFDIGVMAALAALLQIRRLPVARLLFYAMNPLVVVFICGEGHLDVLQAFFLCLGCFLLVNRNNAGGYLSVGLAVMSKYLSTVAVPFCWRSHARWWPLALLVPASLFIPYLSAGSAVFASLLEFATRMHYNDLITEVLGMIVGPWSLEAASLLFLLCLVWVWLTEDDLLRGVYLAVGCLLVMLPTLHPWYLVMIAPFMCFFPSSAWLYLQAAALFTFPVLGHEFRTGVFQEIFWLKLPEYLPFYGLMVWGLFRNGSISKDRLFASPRTVSVIIPTLNEAGYIGRCLAALRDQPGVQDIIVADGGSTDETVGVAVRHGAEVVVGEKGRGVQIRTAADIAQGDVLLILHADAVLHLGALERLLNALTKDPGAAGGCFGMEFDPGGRGRWFISTLNNIRAATTGIVFGDQAQFVRAAALKQIGGFPDLMLMEDVELSLRLKRVGRTVYLRKGVAVSGRRWRTGCFLGNLWKVVRLFFRYLLERRLGRSQTSGQECYRMYYGSSA